MAPPGAGARIRRGRDRPLRARAPATDEPGSGERVPLVTAGICSVVLAVPLAVLGGAAGPYDDPKAWALPILVSATGLAWLARAWRGPRPAAAAPGAGARLVRGLLLASLAWSVITTVTSLAPLQSVMGSFGRGMGLFTTGSATLLFLLVLSECRTERIARTLVGAALLGSVPVCALALGQAAGWDPLPGTWDPVLRSMAVRSTFGSHIFLGSYLVVLIPLTAARLQWACRERLEGGRWPAARVRGGRGPVAAAWVTGAVALVGLASQWAPAWWTLVPWGIVGAVAWARRDDGKTADTALAAGLLAGLLAVQVLVVVLSRGRGAFIGMLVGLSVTSFAFLVRHRAWKSLAIGALGLLGLVGFVALLNLPGSPVRPLASVRLLSRLGDIANVQHGSPGWFRLQVWRGTLDGWGRQLRGEEVFPGQSPRLRSIIGFGPETQALALEPMTFPLLGALPARGEAWSARYIVDRAHNALLDLLVTEGLGGLALWLLLVGGVLVLGVSRIRASVTPGELTMRQGALGALLAHLADGQVGIVTVMPLALFWLAAGLLTSEAWGGALSRAGVAAARDGRAQRPWWATATLAAALLTGLLALTSTRWLLASVSYADGTRRAMAGRMADAYEELRRSAALMPWLPLPAEGVAYTALRLAGSAPDPARRLEFLHDAESTLAAARRYAVSGADSWTLSGQVAFALARAGEPGQLAASREAFAAALRMRPGDAKLLAQWGWSWLESGQAKQAREAAERALARDPREWLAWAVLSLSARDLGDTAGADGALSRARELAPPEAQRLLGTWR
jgi:tetratricopeptide (TPR) repeat protein